MPLNYSTINQSGLQNLTLRQTLTSSGSVTIPAGTSFVYAVVVGGGGAGTDQGSGGGAGAIVQGWVPAANSCIIGGSNGFSRYSTLYAASGNSTRLVSYSYVYSTYQSGSVSYYESLGGAGATPSANSVAGSIGPGGSYGAAAGQSGTSGGGALTGYQSGPYFTSNAAAAVGGSGLIAGGGATGGGQIDPSNAGSTPPANYASSAGGTGQFAGGAAGSAFLQWTQGATYNDAIRESSTGGGGGGGGFLGAGSAGQNGASGVAPYGGTGGNGGGGGGGAGRLLRKPAGTTTHDAVVYGTPGAGGNGVVYLYY